MLRHHWYPWLSLALLAAALLACGQTPTLAPTRAPPPRASPVPAPRVATAFGFGVGYGNLDGGILGTPRRAPASTYAAFGATWVKFTDINWEQIVPRAGLRACGGYRRGARCHLALQAVLTTQSRRGGGH
jgi:hypothetical protein